MKTPAFFKYLPAAVALPTLVMALILCGGSGGAQPDSALAEQTSTSSALSTSNIGISDNIFPLSGPEVFLTSAVELDPVAETITLPLHTGKLQNGETAFYIITDASDRLVAEKLGVNWAPKLANALGTAAVQYVAVINGEVTFSGTIDFSPMSALAPGPTVFPPTTAIPGAVGDPLYSPLITTGDGVVLNAPQVANGSGRHDKVVSIHISSQLVTLRLTEGLYHGKGILYLSTDASDQTAATLEESTYAPNMNSAPGLADSAPDTSARSAIVPIVNGQTGFGNPDRQGLVSAILGEGSPLNVTEIHPRNRGDIPLYSPLWDVHPAVWTDEAIAAGERKLVTHHETIAKLVEEGLLVSGGDGPPNPALGGLRAAGFIVNCPVMALQ